MKKLNLFQSLLVLIAVSISNQAFGSNIALWSTTHKNALTSEVDNQCAQQVELFQKIVNQGEIEKQIPGLRFFTEDKVDDPVIKKYVSIYYLFSEFIQNVQSSVHKKEFTPRFYNSIQAFFNGFLRSNSNYELTALFYEVLDRDQNDPAIAALVQDFKIQNKEIPFQQLGSLPKNGLVLNLEEWRNNPSEEVIARIDTILSAYALMAQRIGRTYFDRDIKKRQMEYDFTVPSLGSQADGKSVIEYAKPETLFKTDHMFGRGPANALSVALLVWRDYFMAKNIIKIIKEDDSNPILVWYGARHMNFVSRYLVMSDQLTEEEKKSIQVVAQQPNIINEACDYKEVVKVLSGKNQGVDLAKWFVGYGAKNNKYKLTIYSSSGVKVYENLSYSTKNWNGFLDFETDVKSLIPENYKLGIFIVHMETVKDESVILFKTLLERS